MQKIVINDCYGGFGLSPLALKRYAELIGKECYFFEIDLKEAKYSDDEKYIPITLEQVSKSVFSTAFSIPNPNEVLKNDKKWSEMTLEERKKSNELYGKYDLNDREIKRDDPNLIKVIEELGPKANGNCAKLKLVEIPDMVEWEIDEYDGAEHVEEVHRKWY
jgi:hypothetical protein